MLSREIMGLLAIGILWVNGLLVLAVAIRQLRNVLALGARFRAAERAGSLISGEVTQAEERFAIRYVQQLGRAMTTRGADRIVFTDGVQSFEVLGGVIDTADGEVEVEPVQPAQSEVWPERVRASEAVACPGSEHFDEAFPQASKYKGYKREIEVEVRVGDKVWVLGDRDGSRVVPPKDAPLVVSMVDPLGWSSSRARLLVLFVGLASASLAAVTVLALWQPWFGTLSTVGGALCVAYFLAIQPIGTAVRDAVKVPGRRPLGGLWVRPSE